MHGPEIGCAEGLLDHLPGYLIHEICADQLPARPNF
jgi:hypothetical protein